MGLKKERMKETMMKERGKERGVPERLKQEVQRREGRGISEGRTSRGVES